MTADDDLLARFESGTLEGAAFGHREHLLVAWRYLEVMTLEAALARYVHHLEQLVERLGVRSKFHRSMTWVWLLLLDEARRAYPGLSFEALVEQVPTLLDAHHAAARVPSLGDAASRTAVRLWP